MGIWGQGYLRVDLSNTQTAPKPASSRAKHGESTGSSDDELIEQAEPNLLIFSFWECSPSSKPPMGIMMMLFPVTSWKVLAIGMVPPSRIRSGSTPNTVKRMLIDARITSHSSLKEKICKVPLYLCCAVKIKGWKMANQSCSHLLLQYAPLHS